MDETFIEEYNLRHLKYIEHMGYKWVRDAIYNPEEEDQDGLTVSKDGQTPYQYANTIVRHARGFIKQGGANSYRLKWAEGRKEGRRYINGWGFQNLQNDLKWFLAPEGYVDLDIVNCHPTFALYLCRENNISVPILDEYVNKRKEVLESNNIKKRDVLRTMYQDNPKPEISWLKRFALEFTEARDKLLDIYRPKHDLTHGKSKNNPKGSAINQLLSIYEDKALCKIRPLIPHQVLTPFFDGIFFKADEPINLDECNERTKEYGIKWELKLRSTKISCPHDWDENAAQTEKMAIYKEMCEQLNPDPKKPLIFKTHNPPCFWRYSPNNGEDFPYQQLNNQGLEHNYNSMGKIENPFEPDQKYKQNFISIWKDDPDIPTYERLDFLPYSKTGDKTPHNVFNTYVPYKYLSEPTDENGEISEKTNNWRVNYLFPFLSALMGETHEIGDKLGESAEWLWRFAIQIVQYPEVRPEVVLGLISRQGTGKDSLVTFISKLIGTRYIKRTSDPDQIFGPYNACLADKLLTQINESESYKAGSLVGKMKDLATCIGHTLSDKYVKGFYVKNYVRQVFCSNETEGVKVECDNRRVNYQRCLNTFQNKTEWWNEFHTGLEDTEIIREIFWIMMRENIEDYDPNKFPISKESVALMLKNVPTFPEWFKQQIEDDTLLENNFTPITMYGKPCPNEYFIGTTELIDALKSYCSENGLKGEGFNKKTIGPKILEMTSVEAHTRKVDGKLKRGYRFYSNKVLAYINNQYYSKIPTACLVTEDSDED